MRSWRWRSKTEILIKPTQTNNLTPNTQHTPEIEELEVEVQDRDSHQNKRNYNLTPNTDTHQRIEELEAEVQDKRLFDQKTSSQNTHQRLRSWRWRSKTFIKPTHHITEHQTHTTG